MYECEFWNNDIQESAFVWAYSIEQAINKAKKTLGNNWHLIHSEYID